MTCGKKFLVIPCRENTAKYCSKECASHSKIAEPNCKCEICGKPIHRKQSHLDKCKHVTCSRECLNELKRIIYSGEGNHQWGLKGNLNASFKGEKTYKKNGSVIDINIYVPSHPYCDKNGRVRLHRLLVEEQYTRYNIKYFEEINGKIFLRKDSYVHHIDGNHNNNAIENLIPVTKSEHRSIHNNEVTIARDVKTGRITGVIKQGELLEKPEEVNQQPSFSSDTLEGSETNSRVLRDSNADTSALLLSKNDDIVRPACITKEDAEIYG